VTDSSSLDDGSFHESPKYDYKKKPLFAHGASIRPISNLTKSKLNRDAS
jgi:hypothetical protein